MPDHPTDDRAWGAGFSRFVTAVSSSVAAMVLVWSMTAVKTLSEQAPLVAEHMIRTTQTLSAMEAEQSNQSRSLAALLRDYTSKEQLQLELSKLDEKIRTLQLQQALLQQRIKADQSRG